MCNMRCLCVVIMLLYWWSWPKYFLCSVYWIAKFVVFLQKVKTETCKKTNTLIKHAISIQKWNWDKWHMSLLNLVFVKYYQREISFTVCILLQHVTDINFKEILYVLSYLIFSIVNLNGSSQLHCIELDKYSYQTFFNCVYSNYNMKPINE